MSDETEMRQLAEEHVEWLVAFIVPIIRKVGVDEFMHGYKHGVQAAGKGLVEEPSNGINTNKS